MDPLPVNQPVFNNTLPPDPLKVKIMDSPSAVKIPSTVVVPVTVRRTAPPPRDLSPPLPNETGLVKDP